MEDLIPCEFCQEAIPFDQYETHVRNVHVGIPPGGVVLHDAEDNRTMQLQFGSDLINLLQQVEQERQDLTTELPNILQQLQQQDGTRPRVVYTLVALDNPELVDMNDYEFNSMIAQQIGNVEVGVDDIGSVTELVEIKKRNQLKESVCAICQEEFEKIPTETNILATLCNHIYCEPCIYKWLATSKKCPVCMLDLEDLKIEKETDLKTPHYIQS